MVFIWGSLMCMMCTHDTCLCTQCGWYENGYTNYSVDIYQYWSLWILSLKTSKKTLVYFWIHVEPISVTGTLTLQGFIYWCTHLAGFHLEGGRKLSPPLPLKTYVFPFFLLEQSEGNVTKRKNPNYLHIISPIGFMFSNQSQLWPTHRHSAC